MGAAEHPPGEGAASHEPPTAGGAVAGRLARRHAPRSGQAEHRPRTDRPDPVDVLERQARDRVPELVPIRYGRMLASPFAFFRGAAAIMAGDLAAAPRTGLETQLCGDAHLSNFGLFASAERRLVFDLNDFDETLDGPFEWDVKRLAASMVVAARENGFDQDEQRRTALATVKEYREAMTRLASMDNLGVWYSRVEVEPLLDLHGPQVKRKVLKRSREIAARAQTRNSLSALTKLTEVVDGEYRIADRSPLIIPIDRLTGDVSREQIGRLRTILATYRDTLPEERRRLLDQFELVDFAHKVVGVGSVGTRSWIALLLGHERREPLFLQIKQAGQSVLEPFLGASRFANHGQRVVVGQRLMQASSDILLGWLRVEQPGEPQRDHYCRQLRDWKGSVEVDQLLPEGLAVYGRLCGATLARAHARAGDRVAIAAYLGASDRFDRAICAFAEAYADQNERDYAALQAAVATGRIVARRDL